MHNPSDTALALAVRGQIAAHDTADALAERVHDRAARLRDDGETGAVVSEYAMLGGVGAAICGIIIKLVRDTPLIQELLSAVIGMLTKHLKAWVPFL